MDWSKDEPLIQNKHVAEFLGAVLIIGGVCLLYDAHEGRGESSPFWMKFLPGL